MNAIRQHARRRVMTAGMFATWLVVGLLTGWLAGVAMPQGGHGLLRDILLALVGSSAAGATLTALDLAPDAGPFTMALVAFLGAARSEEHTSELQSRLHLVCRLLLEKKKNKTDNTYTPPEATTTA